MTRRSPFVPLRGNPPSAPLRGNPRKLTVTTLFLCCLAILVFGCGEKSVKLGLVMPLTGEYQTYGEGNRRGVELALDEIRATDYPVTIELLEPYDTESDPDKARDLLEEAFGEAGAFAVLGGSTSSEAKAMIPVAEKYDRVLLSPSATSPDLTDMSSNFYRIAPSDLTEGNKMADFAFRALGITSVIIIAEQETYARGIQSAFRSAFEHQGGKVMELIELPPNTSDLDGLMGRVMTLKPDGVYLAAHEVGIGSMIQELRSLEFPGRILTTHAFTSPAAIAQVGDAAAGVVLTQSVFELDSDHAHVKKFVTAYRERYDEEPNLFAAEGYDAMKVLAVALEHRHTIPSALGRGLREAVQEFPGVTGSIQFDENGDVKKFPRVYLISKDLLLVDYSRKLAELEQRKKDRQDELRRKLAELQREAAKVDNGGP